MLTDKDRNDAIPPEVRALAHLFRHTREPTVRKLIEFYEDDWETISKLKDELDLSWKDFFRAISTWVSAIQQSEAIQSKISAMLAFDRADDPATKTASGGGGD